MNQDELIEKCRLTDEEIEDYLTMDCGLGCPADYWDGVILEDWHKLVEAQLRKAIPVIEQEYEAECQKRVERIFEEIEKAIDEESYPDDEEQWYRLTIPKSWWKCLKQREGVEK